MGKNRVKNQTKPFRSIQKKKVEKQITAISKKASRKILEEKKRWQMLFQYSKPKDVVPNLRKKRPVMEWIVEDIDEDEEKDGPAVSELISEKTDEVQDGTIIALNGNVVEEDDSDSDWEDCNEEEESEYEMEEYDSDELRLFEADGIPEDQYNSDLEETDDSDFEETDDDFDMSDSDNFYEEVEVDSDMDFDDEDYDSDEDDDFEPTLKDDVHFIARGDAKIYDIDDNSISFADTGTQIIELRSENVIANSDNSNDSCPELVPIEPPLKAAKTKFVQKSVSMQQIADSDDDDQDSSLLHHVLSLSGTVELNTSQINDSDENVTEVENKLTKVESKSKTSPTITNLKLSRTSKCYKSPISSKVILLHLTEKIFIHGNFNAKLIAGGAESCGYQFVTNKSVPLFSPESQSLVYLCPSPSTQTSSTFDFVNLLEQFYTKDLETIRTNFVPAEDALFLLERSNSKRVSCVSSYMDKEVFPKFITHNTQRPFYIAENLLKTVIHSKDDKIRKFEIQDQWREFDVTDKSRFIVLGGQNVGKSHLVRYLINHSLAKHSKVAVLDFDIGQSEIFLPQTLSAAILDAPILGHGCFSPIVPKKSIVFGDISVAHEQIKYIKCVRELIKFCQANEEFKSIPWIVNTMGYSKGLGEEIIVGVIKDVFATDIIQIQSSRTSDNFNKIITSRLIQNYVFNIFTEFYLHESPTFKTFLINAFGKKPALNHNNPYNAKEMRMQIILAHLGEILSRNNETNFLNIIPKIASLNDIKIVSSIGTELEQHSLLQAIDTNIVYLCQSSPESKMINCCGIGIVRGIDYTSNNIFLLPSIADDQLQSINTLVLTSISLPPQIIWNQQTGFDDHEIPFFGKTDNLVTARKVNAKFHRPGLSSMKTTI